MAAAGEHIGDDNPVASRKACFLDRVGGETNDSFVESEVTLKSDKFSLRVDGGDCDRRHHVQLGWTESDSWQGDFCDTDEIGCARSRIERGIGGAVNKRGSDVAKDKGIKVLARLVVRDIGQGSTNWDKVILPNIGDARWHRDKEPLNRDDVESIDPRIAIHVCCEKAASGRDRSNHQEMPLNGQYIEGVDARNAGSEGRLGWSDGVGAAVR